MSEFSVAILTLAACVFAASAGREAAQPRCLPVVPRRAARDRAAAGTPAAGGRCGAACRRGGDRGRPGGRRRPGRDRRSPARIRPPRRPWPLPGLLTATLTAGVAVVIRRGTRARCACFGAGSTRPLGGAHLFRNLALLAVLAFGLASNPLGHGHPGPAGTLAAAAAGARGRPAVHPLGGPGRAFRTDPAGSPGRSGAAAARAGPADVGGLPRPRGAGGDAAPRPAAAARRGGDRRRRQHVAGLPPVIACWSAARGADRLHPGQVIVIERPGEEGEWPAPRRGPVGRRRWVIKRVAAVPGDPRPDASLPATRRPAEARVPPGKLVLLGDNPDWSNDSRQLGYFPAEQTARRGRQANCPRPHGPCRARCVKPVDYASTIRYSHGPETCFST